jgi:hypothetical protein
MPLGLVITTFQGSAQRDAALIASAAVKKAVFRSTPFMTSLTVHIRPSFVRSRLTIPVQTHSPVG